jgi:polyisoprenoid-binding protein YceI
MTTASAAPWLIDATHTDIEFSVRHLMISNVKGRFSGISGTIDFDPAHPELLVVDVAIPVATIDTHNEQRDGHLRTNDFFAAEQFPNITFKSDRLEGDIKSQFKLSGDLTIRGVTKPVTFDVTAEGSGDDPWGNERLGFSATAEINRMDFGVQYNAALEAGGVVVGEKVKIAVNVEVMRAKQAA